MLLFPFSVDRKVLLRAEPDGIDRRWKLLQLNLCNVSKRCFIRRGKKLKTNPKERGHRCANPRGTGVLVPNDRIMTVGTVRWERIN